MKTLIIISMLLLTGCTREYFVFVYVQPENKIPVGQSVLLPYIEGPYIYLGDIKVPITHTPVDRNVVGELPVWFDTHPFDTLKVKPGGAVDFRRIDIDRILKESKYKTDSILFSKP